MYTLLLTLLLTAPAARADGGVCAALVEGKPLTQLLPMGGPVRIEPYLEFADRALAARANGEIYSYRTDPMFDVEAQRVLARMRRRALLWKRDDTNLVQHSRQLFRQAAASALITYRLLANGLGVRLQSKRPMSWGTLFRYVWLTAMLEEEAHADYHLGLSRNVPTLPAYFRVNVGSLHEEIRDFARAAATTFDPPSRVQTLELLVERANALFYERGTLVLPVVNLPSTFERLALAFLPIAWAPLVSPPQRPVLAHFMDLALQESGFYLPLLGSRAPRDWETALRESSHAWFTMLGGEDKIARDPRVESALRFVLFSLRFSLIDGMSPNWAAGEDLIRFLIAGVLFEHGTMRVNRAVRDYFYNGDRHLAPLIARAQRAHLELPEVAAALDLAVARLYAARPDLKDDKLRMLLMAYPNDLVSRRLRMTEPE